MSSWLAMARAWGDLMRPRILALVGISVVLTIGLLVGLQTVLFFILSSLNLGSLTLPLLGEVELSSTLGWGSLTLLPVMGFFLMAPVAAAFCGLFAERVSDTVEVIHYPTNRGSSPDFLEGLLQSLGVVAAMLGVVFLSVILLPFLGPFAPILFYGLNGWLLGREFYQMAALRHLREPHASELRKRNAVTVTWTGVLIALLLTIPLLNVIVPILAASAFTHLFQLTSRSSVRTPRYPRE